MPHQAPAPSPDAVPSPDPTHSLSRRLLRPAKLSRGRDVTPGELAAAGGDEQDDISHLLVLMLSLPF